MRSRNALRLALPALVLCIANCGDEGPAGPQSAPPGATESSVLGPFYLEGAPERAAGADLGPGTPGDPVLVGGVVRSAGGGPIPGATLDLWQTAPDGLYSTQDPKQHPMNLRGRIRTDAEGRFGFRTVMPSSYQIPSDGPVGALLKALGRHPWRPAHIHCIVSAPGHRPVTGRHDGGRAGPDRAGTAGAGTAAGRPGWDRTAVPPGSPAGRSPR